MGERRIGIGPFYVIVNDGKVAQAAEDSTHAIDMEILHGRRPIRTDLPAFVNLRTMVEPPQLRKTVLKSPLV